MTELKSTYQKATAYKTAQGNIIHLSYSVSMRIDRSISITLSKRNNNKK